MTPSARFAAQLAHPRGTAGRLLGRAMDLVNEHPLQLALAALAPRPGERILDAGCGTGAALAAIAAKADCALFGIDRSAEMIETARRRVGPNVTLAQGCIEQLPEWPAFHAVLALNVLYFADEQGAMVAGLHRVLRQGGRLVAYVTHRETMARWPFVHAGLHRLHDAQELQSALMKGGFAPASISIKDHAVAPGIRGLVAHAER